MIMFTLMQVTSLTISLVCLGETMKRDVSKFDKILHALMCISFSLLCFVIQEVK